MMRQHSDHKAAQKIVHSTVMRDNRETKSGKGKDDELSANECHSQPECLHDLCSIWNP